MFVTATKGIQNAPSRSKGLTLSKCANTIKIDNERLGVRRRRTTAGWRDVDEMNIPGSQQDSGPAAARRLHVRCPSHCIKEQSVARITAWCRGTALRQAGPASENHYLLLTVTVAILTVVWRGG